MASMFTCEPDCPGRRPGCQDYCKKHLLEKEAHAKRKDIQRKENGITGYVIGEIRKNQRR